MAARKRLDGVCGGLFGAETGEVGPDAGIGGEERVFTAIRRDAGEEGVWAGHCGDESGGVGGVVLAAERLEGGEQVGILFGALPQEFEWMRLEAVKAAVIADRGAKLVV